jgi:excisionase family DNA binding protein
MPKYSTRQAADRLGLSLITLQRHIANKKIPVPPVTRAGGGKIRIWTEYDIEQVKQVLPSIKNGRKTRYQKKRKQAEKDKR